MKSRTAQPVQVVSRWQWIMKGIYNSFIISGIFVICVLIVRSVYINITRADSYLSEMSPYSSLADVLDIGVNNGLKGRIPKPIFFQVYKDAIPVFQKIWKEFSGLYSEIIDGERPETQETVRTVQTPLIEKPKGASLMYVTTFCKELLGPATTLETCRANLLTECRLDILAWFNGNPDPAAVSACLADSYRKSPDFFHQLDSRIRAKERLTLPPPVARSRAGEKLFLVGCVAVMLVLVVTVLYRVYRSVSKARREKMIQLKLEGIVESLAKKTLSLDDTNLVNEENELATCYDFSSDYATYTLEHEIYGFCTLIVLDPLPIHQVHMTEEKSGDIEREESPPVQYLDISWQKNMLEEARIGITTIHQADFDFDIDGDSSGADEDNIFVTGFEQDKDDPLKFNYWRKRLRDVRDELSAAALAKLKQRCPTLFKLGWFKEEKTAEDRKDSVVSIASDVKPATPTVTDFTSSRNSENGDENLEEGENSNNDGETSDNEEHQVVTRERQLSDNTFIAIE